MSPWCCTGLCGTRARRDLHRSLLLLVVFIATIVPGVLLSAPVIPLCGIPLALAIAQLRRSTEIGPRSFALLLFSLGWALSIGVEIVYIRDVFDDRMNTLVQVLLPDLDALWAGDRGHGHSPLAGQPPRLWPRAVLSMATVAALLAGAVYPIVASYQWTDRFAAWQGLDGLAYGEETDPDDTAAIRWLGQHAAPGDVVLEAAGCSYLPFDRLPFNRVSAFTGIPTIIGWGNNHQRQWRAGQPELLGEIDRREADVAEMFAHPDSPLFDKYGVTWLFVGEYESGDWKTECETAGPYDIPPLLERAKLGLGRGVSRRGHPNLPAGRRLTHRILPGFDTPRRPVRILEVTHSGVWRSW